MTRPTVRLLVTQDLGYCCEWFFFTHYRQTALIAARLGVTERAVRYAKARVDSGEVKCGGCDSCMHAKITLAGDRRKLPLRVTAPDKSPESSAQSDQSTPK